MAQIETSEFAEESDFLRHTSDAILREVQLLEQMPARVALHRERVQQVALQNQIAHVCRLKLGDLRKRTQLIVRQVECMQSTVLKLKYYVAK